MAKPNVLFLGSPYWCDYLKKLFNERPQLAAYNAREIFKWIFSVNKNICLVGIGEPDTWKRQVYYKFAEWMFGLGLINQKVIYWIGSDVLQLSEGNEQVATFLNIAGSPWLTDEVRAKGYACQTCLFPVKIDTRADCPWPQSKQLVALCYLPDQSHELHGSDEVLYLAKHFPEIRFDVLGGTGGWCTDRPANLNFLGWTNGSNEQLKQSHLVLRRTKHDSFSALVREGMAAGRYVVFTYDIPSCLYVKSGDIFNLVVVVGGIFEKFKAGNLEKASVAEEKESAWLDYGIHLAKLEKLFTIS